jgi:hypothetical protein
MQTLIGVAGLILTLIVLWTGWQRLEFNSFQKTLLSVFEVAVLIGSLLALGWLGIGIFVAANVVAALLWSVILAAKKQSILVDASVQSTDMTVEEADEIWHWMKKQKAFAVIRPLRRGELIGALAGQARSPSEIRPMAVAVAQLSVIFDCDPIWLAPRFDQLLRLYGESAADSEKIADTLVTGTKQSATSFKDMLAGMIVAGGGSVEDDEMAAELP